MKLYLNCVYECPERCNNNILVLLQDLYMFRVPAIPFIRSTILQLTVTGITYITLDREMYGNDHFKGCPESDGWSHHSGWVGTQLQLTHCDVTNRPILEYL
jgi:hypothetical protein